MIWRFLAIFILLTVGKGTPLDSFQTNKICLTKECNETASFILNHMDPSISPCKDFYQFACGRFSSPNKDAILYAMRDALYKVVFPQIEEIFMPKLFDDLQPGLQRAYTFYNACTHVNTPLTEGAELILRELPDLDDWNSNNSKSWSWVELIRKSRNLGIETDYILKASLQFNPEDSSTFILRVSPPSIDTKEWKFLNTFTPETSKRITSSINLPEVMNKTRNFQRLLNDILPKPSPSLSEHWQRPYVTSLSHLQNEYPMVNWAKLLQATVGQVVNITNSQSLAVYSRGFIWNLQNLLSRTNSRFGKVIVLKLLKVFYREDKKTDIHNMIALIKEEMQKTFIQSSWIQQDLRKKLLDKLDAIDETIGSQADISELNDAVNNLYKNLPINSKNYFVLLLHILKLGSDLKFSALNDPFSLSVQRLDQTNWPIAPFYQPNIQTMVVPGSYLSDFMYSANRPGYSNFGLIGSVLGHELLHAFHKNGIYIHQNGNVEAMWTSDAAGLEYSRRADCLVKQYSNIQILGTEKKVNGQKTFNENFADNEGVRAAYRAYKLWLEQHPYEESLPNLNYTSTQMFWITNANLWCAYLPREELLKKVPSYTHAPPWDRVNAVFSNMEEFAADFGCPENSNMNPTQKCSTWK